LLALLLALVGEEDLGRADVDGAWSATVIVDGACEKGALVCVMQSQKDKVQTRQCQYLKSGGAVVELCLGILLQRKKSLRR